MTKISVKRHNFVQWTINESVKQRMITITRSPNCSQIWLTGVYQYGQIFDGFFITAQRNVSKNFFPQKNHQMVCRSLGTT